MLNRIPLPSYCPILVLYMFLSSWSLQYSAFLQGTGYNYILVATTAMFLWAACDEMNPNPCLVIAIIQLLTFVQDMFVLGFHFSDADNFSQHYNRGEFVFSAMAFFANFILRPLYCVIGFIQFLQRDGSFGEFFIAKRADAINRGNSQAPLTTSAPVPPPQ